MKLGSSLALLGALPLVYLRHVCIMCCQGDACTSCATEGGVTQGDGISGPGPKGERGDPGPSGEGKPGKHVRQPQPNNKTRHNTHTLSHTHTHTHTHTHAHRHTHQTHSIHTHYSFQGAMLTRLQMIISFSSRENPGYQVSRAPKVLKEARYKCFCCQVKSSQLYL